ncbi:MAG TPA: Rieske (2Fe-2S) protein [Caldilineaceae bacterium]|nr:Rieske (2Fe-2S) protein [Caldilineaceae bacterium]
MAKHIVGPVSELPVGSRKIIEINGRTIGVFNANGTYYALRNMCPHQAAPLCKGHVTGTTLPSQPGEYQWERDGEILRCPWHGWEFDITNGQSVFNPHKWRVKTYEVTVERGGELVKEQIGADDEDPSVETFPVTIEDELVVLHV